MGNVGDRPSFHRTWAPRTTLQMDLVKTARYPTPSCMKSLCWYTREEKRDAWTEWPLLAVALLASSRHVSPGDHPCTTKDIGNA
jgi:hypothetical protein